MNTRYKFFLYFNVAISISFLLFEIIFTVTNFYNNLFNYQGNLIVFYNIARSLLVFLYLYLILALGGIFLWLIVKIQSISLPQKKINLAILCFLCGAGLWQIIIFILGLTGYIDKLIFIALSFLIMVLSPLPYYFLNNIKFIFLNRKIKFLIIFYIIISIFILILFLIIKGLYPAGGHDYYLHYFQYYLSVIRNQSILPNEVWYHFYYSKGAGLYFLSILLSDPLAPQLMGTGFIVMGSLIIYQLVFNASKQRFISWFGAILYLLLYIYTPGPYENMVEGGWGDLEKVHEPTAVLVLGVLWCTTHLFNRTYSERNIFFLAIVLTASAAILFSMAISPFILLFLTSLLGIFIFRKDRDALIKIIFTIAYIGIFLLLILLVNYLFTGLVSDQLILFFWPYINFSKLSHWGVLGELIFLHYAFTGIRANSPPLGIDFLSNVFFQLRLDIWGPLYILGIPALIVTCRKNCIHKLNFNDNFNVVNIILLVFIVNFIALSCLFGRGQTISFYRFSSFTYGPILCFGLILCSVVTKNLVMRLFLIIFVTIYFYITYFNGGSLLLKNYISSSSSGYLETKKNSISNILLNAIFLQQGKFSLKDSYQNQQGWPGRMPWGGIFPPMEIITRIIGANTPIYTLHVHTYCMLPGCRLYSFFSTLASKNPIELYYASPEIEMQELKKSGIDYFIFSKDLQIGSALPKTPLFAPENIGDYMGIKWTNGSTYLLTWKGDGVKAINQIFLDDYKYQIQKSLDSNGYPFEVIHKVLMQMKDNPTAINLPW